MDLIDAIVTKNKTEVLTLLVEGADVGCCDDSAKITPLHHAIACANIEIIFLLMEFGASPYQRSEAGETPFEIACSLKRWDVVSLIINWNHTLKVH